MVQEEVTEVDHQEISEVCHHQIGVDHLEEKIIMKKDATNVVKKVI